MTVDAAFIQSFTGGYSAEITRRAIYSLLKRGATIGSVAGGLVNLTDLQTTWSGTGLGVVLSPGECVVPGSSVTTQSGYYFRASANTSLTPAAANPSNPRVDLVYAQIQDSAYSGSYNLGTVALATGTPTAGATLGNLNGAPAVPLSSLALAYVLIPAGATSISNADIANVATAVQASFASSALCTIGGSTGAPSTGTYVAGAIWLDTNGYVWICTSGGTPGTWEQVTFGAFPAVDSLGVVSNAVTVPVGKPSVNITNNAAASVTITITTSGAVDGQTLLIRFYDYSAVAQALAFVNAETGAVTVPASSNGSTTLPLSIGFIYNGATSKWRCMAAG